MTFGDNMDDEPSISEDIIGSWLEAQRAKEKRKVHWTDQRMKAEC
jgi:hypothetical protein